MQSLQQKPEVAKSPISRINPKIIVNVGVNSISYKLPAGLSGGRALSEISRICLAHPQGKALAIFNASGKSVYSFTVEQSIF